VLLEGVPASRGLAGSAYTVGRGLPHSEGLGKFFTRYVVPQNKRVNNIKIIIIKNHRPHETMVSPSTTLK
jgi:hypothetical protein